MTSWHTYPSIYNLGHRYLEMLLVDPVLIEEKIDGSQFSFGRFGDEFRFRSKGAIIHPEAPPKMFKCGVDAVLGMDLHDGWTYRGELLSKPKHNTLAYDRIPANHVILFDINTGEEAYLGPEEKMREAERIGLEAVPVLYNGMVGEVALIHSLLDTVSILGGQKIEGVVVKNYNRFSLDKKVLMGKFVSEAFKEVHHKDYKERHPGNGDIIATLIGQYRSEARWNKAVQHLREADRITDSPKDIGLIIPEIIADVDKECAEEIKEALYKWAMKDVRRGLVAGVPEWYKQGLLDKQFEGGGS